MTSRMTFLAAFLALMAAWSPTPVASQGNAPQDLVKYLPTEVNTLALFNVNRIMSSDRAKREGWTKISHMEYLAGAVPVHPSILRMLVGSEFNGKKQFKGSSHSVVPVLKKVDMEALAKTQGGGLIDIGGEKAVQTVNDHIILKLGDQLLGAVSSDNRQDAARWLAYTKTAMVSKQSKYLFNAIYNQGGTADIVMAMDLEHFFNGVKVGKMAAASPILQQNQDAQTLIANFMTGLRGIRFFAIIYPDGTHCSFHLDSNCSLAKVQPELFRAFLCEFIESLGAHLGDLKTATVKASENSVELRFPLSDVELAGITAYAMPQDHGISEENTIIVNRDEPDGKATFKYFRAVNQIVQQIRPYIPSNIMADESAEYKKKALWHDQAANRISNISTMNVDKDMVAYGQGCAGRLHAIADSLRGLANLNETLLNQSYFYNYGRWGGVDTNYGQLTQQMNTAADADIANRKKLWKLMDDLKSRIAAEMTKKYGIDFTFSK